MNTSWQTASCQWDFDVYQNVKYLFLTLSLSRLFFISMWTLGLSLNSWKNALWFSFFFLRISCCLLMIGNHWVFYFWGFSFLCLFFFLHFCLCFLIFGKEVKGKCTSCYMAAEQKWKYFQGEHLITEDFNLLCSSWLTIFHITDREKLIFWNATSVGR